jgi:PUA-domain protein
MAEDLEARLRDEIGEAADQFITGPVELVETDSPLRLYMVDKKPYLMELSGIVFPTLRGALERPFPQKRVVVDSGAVRFVVNGADVMRPGIVAVTDDVKSGSPVQVAEERHGKAIAIGIALADAEGIRAMETGKACRNIHHVGDEIWGLEL